MKKNSTVNMLYNISLILMLVRTYINNSLLENIFQYYDLIIIPTIVVLLFVKLLNDNYKLKELLIIIFCFVICLIAAVSSSKMILLVSFLGIISLKNIDVKKSINVLYKSNKFLLIAFTVVYLLNLIFFPNSISYSIFYKGLPRHSFYFNHPNMYSGLFFWCVTGYLYNKGKKLNILNIMIVIILSLLVYKFTYTRTMLLSVAMLLIMLILRNNKIEIKLLKIISKYGMMIFSTLFLILLNYYNSFSGVILNIVNIFDSLLSHRIKLAVLINKVYPVTIFPSKINYNLVFSWNNEFSSKLVLDNFYYQCLMVYGIVLLIIFAFVFYFGSKKVKNNTDYIYISLVLITGIVESYMLNCCICFPILLLGNNIVNNRNLRGEDENEI